MSGHDHTEGVRDRRRALIVAIVLTASFTGLEVVAGLLTGSLAWLADAGHMVSDVGSLAMALAAFWLAGQPATRVHSFGFKRAEVLAALAGQTRATQRSCVRDPQRGAPDSRPHEGAYGASIPATATAGSGPFSGGRASR